MNSWTSATGRRGRVGWGAVRPAARPFVMFGKATLSALMVVALTMPGLAMPKPPAPLESAAGTIVWYPDRHQGWRTLAVIDTGEGLTVFSAEENRYQDATLEGAYQDGRSLSLRYIEVLGELEASQAASTTGWRQWARTDSYMRLVFERKAGRQSVRVYEAGTAAWLVVLISVGGAE